MSDTAPGPDTGEPVADHTVATRAEMLQLVRDSIERIAPDADVSTLATDVDYRDEVDLDSMDFLAVLTALEQRTGVNIPEIDYADIGTLDQLTDYLVTRATAGPNHGVTATDDG